MKKQPEITEQTKNNLRAAFWTLYRQKPIEKITVKEVTDLAGYNRGTFYLHYKDLYDLFGQIEDEILDSIHKVVEEARTKKKVFDLSDQMGFLMKLMQTHSHYASVLLGPKGDPRFVARLKEIIWPLLNQYFVPTKENSPYEMELLAEFYLSGILAAVSRWLSEPEMSIEQFLSFMIQNIFPLY